MPVCIQLVSIEGARYRSKDIYIKHLALSPLVLINILFYCSAEECVTNEGENGVCKYYENCKIAMELNNTRGIPASLCGIMNGNKREIVCCTDINSLLNPSTDNWNFPEMKVYKKKCQEYAAEKHRLELIQEEMSQSKFFCENGTCFILATPYVIGGVNAGIDEFPHMVEIGWEKIDGDIAWKCGGSLISKDFILTAAHCLYNDDPQHIQPEPSKIRLGGSWKTVANISLVIYHPEYISSKKYNDIALIRLSKPIEFISTIRPACLLNNETLAGNATVIGWGITTLGGDRPNMLQKVTLKLLSQGECKSGYPSSRNLPYGIVGSQFCAGYEFGGKDSCTGDSGSPIQTMNKHHPGMFDIIGVTSFGNGCGSKNGGVYTKISHYINWISSYVWPDEHALEKYLANI